MNSARNISLVAVVVLLSVSFASVSSAKGRWHAAKTRLAAELKKDLAKERLAILRMATGLKELRQNPRAFLSSQIQTWRANAAANRAARRAEDAARRAELQQVCRERSTLAFALWCDRITRRSNLAYFMLVTAALACSLCNPMPPNEIEVGSVQDGVERVMQVSSPVAIERQSDLAHDLASASLLFTVSEGASYALLKDAYDYVAEKYEQSDRTDRLSAFIAAVLLKKMVGTSGKDANGLTPVFWAELSGSETAQALVGDETEDIYYLSKQERSQLEQELFELESNQNVQ